MTFVSQLALLWLLAFGFGYAVRVARRPFRPTWLMVVVGVGGTLAGISAILWDLSQDWFLALVVPWGGFAATGGAMILGQVWKAKYQRREAHEHLRDEDDGDHYAQSQAVALSGQARARQDPGAGAGRPGQGREN
jgi:uncharacterized membrane protein YccC